MKIKRLKTLASTAAAAVCIIAITDDCSLLYEPEPGTVAPVNAPKKKLWKNMALIRAKDSSFMMGSNNISKLPDWTKPAHSVGFTYNFWMDTAEVAQGDYDSLMTAFYAPKYTPGTWDQNYGSGARNPVFARNWYDAALYCNARSKRDRLDTVYRYTDVVGALGVACQLESLTVEVQKKGYRLPTEAEWEYACRAKTTGEFFWNDTKDIGKYVWYSANSNNKTHPVAEKLPNGFGLYDMSGNVSEWCNDWYGLYPTETLVDVFGPPASSTNKRILRGGSSFEDASMTYSASRGVQYPYSASHVAGFRVVLPTDSL